MSLAQLVAHFNQRFHRAEWAGSRAPFALEEGAVVAGFHGMRLESAFEALVDPIGEVLGHRARLHAFSPRGKNVSSRAPYAVALDEDSVVYLDRLIRTLHALNAAARGLAGLGPWPEGEALLAELRAGASSPPAGSPPTTAPASRPTVAENEAV